MAIFTLEEIADQKAAWKRTLKALSTSKEYTMGRRRMTREDLPEVRATLEFLEVEERKLLDTAGPVVLAGRPRR